LELKIHKIVFNYLYLYRLQNIHNMAKVITFIIGGEPLTCLDVVMTQELEELLDTHITQKETNWREWGPRKRKNDDDANETVKAKKRGFPGRAFPLNVLPSKQLDLFLSKHPEVVEEEIDFHDYSSLSHEVEVNVAFPITTVINGVLPTVVIGDVDDELNWE